jgi:hypothetical protein
MRYLPATALILAQMRKMFENYKDAHKQDIPRTGDGVECYIEIAKDVSRHCQTQADIIGK